ncbi:sugar ABC transporter ATP-binding protein, partial [Sinorhizobium meliloti]
LTVTGEEMTIECRGEERPQPKQAVRLTLAPEEMFAFEGSGERLR